MVQNMGRPLKTGKPLNKSIKVRVDEDTYKTIHHYAKMNNIKIVDIVRQSLALYFKKHI